MTSAGTILGYSDVDRADKCTITMHFVANVDLCEQVIDGVLRGETASGLILPDASGQ